MGHVVIARMAARARYSMCGSPGRTRGTLRGAAPRFHALIGNLMTHDPSQSKIVRPCPPLSAGRSVATVALPCSGSTRSTASASRWNWRRTRFPRFRTSHVGRSPTETRRRRCEGRQWTATCACATSTCARNGFTGLVRNLHGCERSGSRTAAGSDARRRQRHDGTNSASGQPLKGDSVVGAGAGYEAEPSRDRRGDGLLIARSGPSQDQGGPRRIPIRR